MRRTQRILSRAVIQGDFESDERDYPNIFADLIAALQGKAPESVFLFFCYFPLIVINLFLFISHLSISDFESL